MDYFSSNEFDLHLQSLVREWHVPGLAIAVVQDNKIASKAFGHGTLNPDTLCTADSIFDIASCSKSFTAASVALLVEDQQEHPDLQWDTPMSKLLPEDFVMMEDEYTKTVTLEDILSHRSGLPSHDSSYLGERSVHQDTAASVTRNLRNLPINHPIRSKFQYCNLMYTVATHLIERRSGMSFTDYLQQNFFTPLGMNSTHLHRSAAKAAGLVSQLTLPYIWHKSTKTYRAVNPTEEPEAQGAGAIYTTVNDFILYIRAVLRKSSPLTLSVVSEITKPRILVDNDDEDLEPFTSFTMYALGWEILFYRGYRVVKHDGGITGYTCVAFLLPELNFGCCVLGNSGDGSIVGDILVKTLVDRLLGIPESECVDWNARAQKQRAKYGTKSKEEYNQVKKDLLGDDISESEPQTLPLEVYTGKYHNSGYHDMQIQIKHGRLFIDAYDRSMRFSLTFEHIRDQKVFIANLVESEDDQEQEYFKAEFVLANTGQEGDEKLHATRIGLKIEPSMEELIWFDKITE